MKKHSYNVYRIDPNKIWSSIINSVIMEIIQLRHLRLIFIIYNKIIMNFYLTQ